MPRHGIIVVDDRRATHLIHHVHLCGRRYPVTPHTGMIRYFFAVRHAAGPRAGALTYYFSPDAYFTANHMPREDDRDALTAEEHAAYAAKRGAFKAEHAGWYDLHARIQADPGVTRRAVACL